MQLSMIRSPLPTLIGVVSMLAFEPLVTSGLSAPPAIDGRGVTWEDFVSKGWDKRAVKITGLLDNVDLSKWGQAEFVGKYGQHHCRWNNGRFDGARYERRQTFQDYLSNANDTKGHVFHPQLQSLGDGSSDGESVHHAAVAEVEGALKHLFGDVTERRILSLGVNGSETHVHSHKQTYFALLAGKKLWWIADRNAGVLNDKKELVTRSQAGAYEAWKNPCGPSLDEVPPKGVHRIIQLPGEVIYFGDEAPHATCNLDPFTFGIGAQGSLIQSHPLLRATARGDTDAVRAEVAELLRSGTNKESAEIPKQALELAILTGFPSVPELLLPLRVDLNQPGVQKKHRRPVQLAAEAGHLSIVNWLLDKGVTPPSIQGAAWLGHTAMVELLHGRGVSLDFIDPHGDEPFPLGHKAAQGGHIEVLELLSSKGVDVKNMKDKYGMTALHHSAWFGTHWVAEWLLRKRCSTQITNVAGQRPIDIASKYGHTTVTELLLKRGKKRKARQS